MAKPPWTSHSLLGALISSSVTQRYYFPEGVFRGLEVSEKLLAQWPAGTPRSRTRRIFTAAAPEPAHGGHSRLFTQECRGVGGVAGELLAHPVQSVLECLYRSLTQRTERNRCGESPSLPLSLSLPGCSLFTCTRCACWLDCSPLFPGDLSGTCPSSTWITAGKRGGRMRCCLIISCRSGMR